MGPGGVGHVPLPALAAVSASSISSRLLPPPEPVLASDADAELPEQLHLAGVRVRAGQGAESGPSSSS